MILSYNENYLFIKRLYLTKEQSNKYTHIYIYIYEGERYKIEKKNVHKILTRNTLPLPPHLYQKKRGKKELNNNYLEII